jgi:hypothetical protein
MLSALTISQIEERARERLSRDRAVLLIFATYNGEADGKSADFLRRVLDYHYQSSEVTDRHCIGYTQWEPTPDVELGEAVRISRRLPQHFSFFYPRLFHQVRAHVQGALGGEWNYTGGIDILLFPTGTDEKPVRWDIAAIVSSRDVVGKAFIDEDELIRSVINFSEEFAGLMEPHQLDNEINRRLLVAAVKRVGSKLAGPFVSAGVRVAGA